MAGILDHSCVDLQGVVQIIYNTNPPLSTPSIQLGF